MLMSDVRIVLCSLCITCLIVLSSMSPWSLSSSELDWAKVGLFASRVLWWMGSGRLLVAVVGLLVMCCSWLVPGGCLMGGGFDSSITVLHLSSLTYSKEGSISFASNCFNSLVIG